MTETGIFTGEGISFSGLHLIHFSDIARIGNRSSIRAYQNFGGVPVTVLIGVFQVLFPDYSFSCPEYRTELNSGIKPALYSYWMADRLPDGLEHIQAPEPLLCLCVFSTADQIFHDV